MLSTAEEDLIAGKINNNPINNNTINNNTIITNTLPAPVTQQTPTVAFWTVSYWSHYFQIDTNMVTDRMLAAIVPTKQFHTVLANNPDFYGPFWIPTTVIFVLFAASTVAESIANKFSKTQYTFDITLLSSASVTVYSFVTLLPAILFAIAKWYKINQIGLVDMINLFGYGMSIWIPVSIVCILPSDILRWILVIVAVLVSTLFVVKNLKAVTAEVPDQSIVAFLVFTAVIAQVGLGLLFKFQFFPHTITSP
ncbi:hypothetical protein BC833DRAFT_531829 [Globomyces pollinis-pini]|nr:hypothetical protein BC833DRAFT_531829 [Globomyces pollinis-pini]